MFPPRALLYGVQDVPNSFGTFLLCLERVLRNALLPSVREETSFLASGDLRALGSAQYVTQQLPAVQLLLLAAVRATSPLREYATNHVKLFETPRNTL